MSAASKRNSGIARKAVLAKIATKNFRRPVMPEDLYSLLGLALQIHDKYEEGPKTTLQALSTDSHGQKIGGEILICRIHRSSLEKRRHFILTGKLGDVMKESASIAYQW